MKAISYWASQHVWQARFLLILIGVFRGVVGVLFGFMFLKNMNSIQMNVSLFLLLSIVICVEIYYNRKKRTMLADPDKLYTFKIYCLSILYTLNFALFMLVGNAVYRFEPTEEWANKTILYSNISSNNAPSVYLEKKEILAQKRLFSLEKLRIKWQQKLRSDESMAKELEFTAVGFLLLLLCCPILFGLACSAACSGDEVLAVVLLLLTIGSLVGGFYFLVKAARLAKKRRETQYDNEKQLKTEKMKTHITTSVPRKVAPKLPKLPKTPEELAEAKAQKKYVKKILIILAIALALGLLMFL